MRYLVALFFMLAALVVPGPVTVAAAAGLQPWADNPWYWSYRGEPVLLLGGSDDDNLFQWPEKDLLTQLDRLTAAGGNCHPQHDERPQGQGLRGLSLQEACRRHATTSMNGTTSTGRGSRRMLRETARRRIFVQIEVWDRFDYTDQGGKNRWQIHPYNPKNNVNYTYEESGFAERYPGPSRPLTSSRFSSPRRSSGTTGWS